MKLLVLSECCGIWNYLHLIHHPFMAKPRHMRSRCRCNTAKFWGTWAMVWACIMVSRNNMFWTSSTYEIVTRQLFGILLGSLFHVVSRLIKNHFQISNLGSFGGCLYLKKTLPTKWHSWTMQLERHGPWCSLEIMGMQLINTHRTQLDFFLVSKYSPEAPYIWNIHQHFGHYWGTFTYIYMLVNRNYPWSKNWWTWERSTNMECDSNHYRLSKAQSLVPSRRCHALFQMQGLVSMPSLSHLGRGRNRPLRVGRRDHLLLIPILGKVGGSFLCVPLLLLDACYRIPSCGLWFFFHKTWTNSQITSGSCWVGPLRGVPSVVDPWCVTSTKPHVSTYITFSILLSTTCMHIFPVVPRMAVAEVSKIGHL